MKDIYKENGQCIEVFTSLKEALVMVYDQYINNKEWLDDDFSLCIEYKNGSFYFLNDQDEDGKFKKTGIKTIIESNPNTYQVYGDYEIIKTDTEEDDENCTWIVQ